MYFQRMTKDLTTGKPFGLIFGFSVPLLFGYLFQQFYTAGEREEQEEGEEKVLHLKLIIDNL